MSRFIRTPHECAPPAGRFSHRTVWQCDCGRRWKYCKPGNPDYEGWRGTWPDSFGLWRLRRVAT